MKRVYDAVNIKRKALREIYNKMATKLKILFATIPQPRNRFVRDLQEGLAQYANVVYDYEVLEL